ASAHIGCQPLREAVFRAGIGSLPAPRHGSRLAVILLEIMVEPRIRPVAVLINTYGEIHRAGERFGIASCRACALPDLFPQARPFLGSGRKGQPAIEIAPGALNACRQRAANPDRRSAWTMRRYAKDPALHCPSAAPIHGLAAP